ncbi:PDZ domain-containing protein [Streptomyces sp. NPDC050264]|uniref:PDZ domain-containing protein n=1 Tax=Streptomyces sp. NPDC050264 TaxID=3155038 RepID=UPI003412F334
MEQTALRPKRMPGAPVHDPGKPGPIPRPARRPHAARRRGRRLVGLLSGLLCALVLVLAGVGLGTVGATVIGMSELAEMQQKAAVGAPPKPSAPSVKSSSPAGSASALTPTPPAARGSLGVEVVDAPKGPGALVVAVHVPGPGYSAGLVRGDVLLSLGTAGIGSAGDLAAVVSDARPGHQLPMTVRHMNGVRQTLAVTPGVVT